MEMLVKLAKPYLPQRFSGLSRPENREEARYSGGRYFHFPCKLRVFLTQARKKSTKINVLGPVGWGSSTRRGGDRKVRALPRKFVFLGFRRQESGMSREFCRDVPDPWGCSKSLCNKVGAHFPFPKTSGFSKLSFKEPMFCTLASRGFRRFCVFCESSNQTSCL